LLRRELDNRFLDRSGLTPGGPPQLNPNSPSTSVATSLSNQTSSQSTPPGNTNAPQQSNVPFLRQELHHHQHQHTHLHQHQHQHQSLLPAAPSASLFPPPLFKDIPKIGAVDSPFYRTGPAMVGMPPYPYPSGILHPGLSGPTQFVPPSHLQSFVPKVINYSIYFILSPFNHHFLATIKYIVLK
jgi:autism susceptibility gene 2 protein